MPNRPESLTERFVAEVVDYTTTQFWLREDLAHLEQVQRVGAPEAVILYCARMLEVLAGQALAVVQLPISPNVFANLESLRQFNLIPTTTCYWGHALRRIGNLVRHIQRRVGALDADWAVVFVERWLNWFFCHFRYGLRLPRLTRTVEQHSLAVPEHLHALIHRFDAHEFNPTAYLQETLARGDEAFFQNTAMPAVLAQMLLERDECEAARRTIETARGAFPDDLRLRQLMGLYWSRTGSLADALAWLEPLYAQFTDDEETAGILAGVYKRRWQADRNNFEWLEKCRQAYRQGWERSSRKSNAWLGINAAATTLWLGRPAEARQLAAEVGELLLARAAALSRHATDADLAMNFWQQVTLAEAELLRGKLTDARRRYRGAFAGHPELQANIDITRRQLEETLRALGLSGSAETFLAMPPATSENRPLVVGVTGHRRLPEDERLTACLRQTLEAIRRDSNSHLVALSPLAEGADRLVANAILSAPFNGSLHVILPLELDDYSKDFGTAASLAEFQQLLDRAAEIVYPPTLTRAKQGRGKGAGSKSEARVSDRTAAYEWAGRCVVDRCDVLVALWDGQPAQGRGGTAEIVAYARLVGRPLVWISTAAPFEVIGENGVNVPQRG